MVPLFWVALGLTLQVGKIIFRKAIIILLIRELFEGMNKKFFITCISIVQGYVSLWAR